MKMEFIPVDYDSFDHEGKNYVKIYGRNQKGEKICVIDSCQTYLWAILKEGITEKLITELSKEIETIQLDMKGRKTKVEKVEIHEKNFLGKKFKALKIFGTNHKDLHDIASKIDSPLIYKRRGYDINYITTYIIEEKIYPLNWYEISGEILHNSNEFGGIDQILDVDFVIKLNSKKIKEKQIDFVPRTLAYDLETDSLKPENGEILMFSLVGKNYKKVVSWKKAKTDNKNVIFVENEKELLKKFVELVKKYSPDFLIGYHSDNFDLPFLKDRAKKNKIKLPLGIDRTDPKISGGKNSSGKISGITHIDLLKFIRTAYAQYMQSETLSLNEVSKEFLKDSKTDFKLEHSSKIKENDWKNYYEYNLQDSVLTLKLFEKFWPDLLEFTKIIKEPTFNISRNGLSKQIESYLLHNLEKYNEIPEKRPTNKEIEFRQNSGGVEGAFVYEPKPGLYENLVMFDFTSMHTSIIISHNISKGTLTTNKKNSYESPEIDEKGIKRKYYFVKEPGFFPLLLKEIFEKRKKFKQEYVKNPNTITKARSNAFKVLSASAHGYVGFYGARYYSFESSSAILAFVRQFNKETIEKIEKDNHEVIYGDTDSVAFTRENNSKEEIKQLLKKLNNDLPGVMHLELEDFFKRGLWVTTRSGTTGAKKKYALISEKDIIKIRGFETVRRDWCPLARKTQDKILRLILKEGNEKKALEYIKEIINKLKTRKIKKEEIMIKSQIKKPIFEYKSISPAVVAAKKMKEKGLTVNVGSPIEYFIAEYNGKSKLVRDKIKLSEEKGDYNIEYYLEKQIIPSVENIFQVFKINIKEMSDGIKQEKLKKWF